MFTKTNSPEGCSTSAGAFLLHSMTALLGCGLCADFAGVLLVRTTGFDPASSNSNLLMWYSPFIWWAGLLLGLIANWRSRSSVACLTWLSGALLLALLMADFYWITRSWDRTMMDIFPLLHGESSPDDVLGVNQIFFVWPAMNSFAYSLGASIPLLLGDPRARERPPHQ
jgi:hypothetical protein